MMVNSNTERTPLINDYGPAIRAARMATDQERLDARSARSTNIRYIIAAALCIAALVIVQVLPTADLERSNTLYPTTQARQR